ncbi:MCE family protein [Actinocorallia aurantiaca]|uniref:Phospholipid/cholesterol/gamma-HCH transport system substrate-binding protein n=1 Tax=Actinocorallia aurantiaca TaxID=46204 RepID=A0ABP6H277_9ACTN
MRPRILLNLAVFAAVAVLMFAWAALTLLPIRFGEDFIEVKADFASSPGLRSGLEVDYLGVPIGSVESVELRPGRVTVTLLVEQGRKVPNTVTAQVLRKSAVGEPYVELAPPSSGPIATALKDGDVIPVERTDSTVQYQKLFDSAGRMLRSIDPADLKTLTRELAVGLDGRGQQLHDALADLDHLTGAIADQAGVLDALSVQLTALAGTLSDKRTQLASGMNDLALFTSTLSGDSKKIDSLLDNGPNLMQQVNALLKEVRPGLRCVLTAAGTPAPSVFDDTNSEAVRHAMKNLRDVFPKMVADVLERPGNGGTYVRATAVISVAGPVPNPPEYSQPRPDPEEPPIYHCRDAPARSSAPKKTERPEQKPEEAARPAGTDPQDVFRTVAPRPVAAPEEESLTDTWLPRLPMVVAALVLLGTAAHTVRRVRSVSGPRRRS